MMSDARSKRISAVVCYRLDCVSRNISDFSGLIQELERETIAERIRDNMHELVKTGRWLGGTIPTGDASECYNIILEQSKQNVA